MCFHCLKVLDSELKAYSGIVKNLGKEAEKLRKTDPADNEEIATKQVQFPCSFFDVFYWVNSEIWRN